MYVALIQAQDTFVDSRTILEPAAAMSVAGAKKDPLVLVRELA